MIRFTIFILILVSFTAGSCAGRKSNLDKKNLIPEKEMVDILIDVHLSNGLMILPRIHSWYTSIDTSTTYNYIVRKHGYSRETMDKTIKYYFVNKPKKLIEIYDEVLGRLSEMESLVDKETVLADSRSINLWNTHDICIFPDPSGNDSTRFDIPLRKAGIYTFSFTITLFPDDQSVNPRLTAYTGSRVDTTQTGKPEYLQNINYIKDGQPHRYFFNIDVPRYSLLRLKGQILNYDNHPDNWENHVIIRNITLNFIQAPV
jgi:hypothetical protein